MGVQFWYRWHYPNFCLFSGAYYVCQAAGIGIVGLLFAKRMALAGGWILPLCASVVALICTAASLFTPSLAVIITTGALLNIAIGVLSGCYLTRLAAAVLFLLSMENTFMHDLESQPPALLQKGQMPKGT